MKIFFLLVLVLSGCSFISTEYSAEDVVDKDGLFYSKTGNLITGKIFSIGDKAKYVRYIEKGKIVRADILKEKQGELFTKSSYIYVDYPTDITIENYYDNGVLKHKRIADKKETIVFWYDKTGKILLSAKSLVPMKAIGSMPDWKNMEYTCYLTNGQTKKISDALKNQFEKDYLVKIVQLEFQDDIDLNIHCETYT